MFYENLLKLCSQKGISLTHLVTKELRMSVSNVTKWKEGKVPKADTVKKIADYFGVTIDYLLTGKKQENIKVYDEDDNIVALDDETLEVIDSLRKRPEMKILFSVSKKATKEDIIKAVKIIEALRDTKEGD